MDTLKLSCQCGQVTGSARGMAPHKICHVVCYCKDCRAFVHELGHSDTVLDHQGGTAVVQMAPSQLRIEQGQQHMRSLRLTEKGLLRWYAGCCNTPIGNTYSAGVPFVGVIRQFISDDEARVAPAIGPVRAYVHIGSADGALNEAQRQQSSLLRYGLHFARKLLVWKLTGQGSPTPLFDQQGKPVSEPRIVNAGKNAD